MHRPHITLTLHLILLVISISSLGAQSGPSADQLKEARKTMDHIESTYVASGEDMKAISLIQESKMAIESAYLYLLSLPGYQEAVENKTLLKFKDKVREEDKNYRKLDKAARKVIEKKEEYLASINDEYREALAVMEN